VEKKNIHRIHWRQSKVMDENQLEYFIDYFKNQEVKTLPCVTCVTDGHFTSS
jgi:hypothetical protein